MLPESAESLTSVPRPNGVSEHDEQRTFESMYSAFSRMHVQRTWDAIMNAPVDLDDVVLAELAWAASKSVLGVAILAVVWLLACRVWSCLCG